MTLGDLGNIGEFIGAIFVVVSFFYLALQIRQNTRAVRNSTYQSALDSTNQVTELILAHPYLERIYRLGRRDLSQLTEDERSQFRMLINQFFNVFETMFLQHQRGMLDEDFWRARLTGLKILVSHPGVRSFLESRYASRFRGRVPAFGQLLQSLLDDAGKPAAEPDAAADVA